MEEAYGKARRMLGDRSQPPVFLERYFLVPALLALLSAIALAPEFRPPLAALSRCSLSPALAGRLLAISAALVILCQQIDFLRHTGTAATPQAAMRRALQAEVAGTTIETYLRRVSSLTAPVLSNQSQLLHLLIERPTVGVPQYRLTPRSWSGDDIVAVARRVGARYAVVFRRMPIGASDGSTDYVWRVAQAGHPALVPMVTTDEVALFQITAN